jgi:hypothetical protein
MIDPESITPGDETPQSNSEGPPMVLSLFVFVVFLFLCFIAVILGQEYQLARQIASGDAPGDPLLRYTYHPNPDPSAEGR